jgi:PAS domain S-box-containing protein
LWDPHTGFFPKVAAMSSEIPSAIVQFFNDSRVPLVLCDANLRDDPMIHVNDAFCKMSGYDRAELLGKNCRVLQGPDTQKSIRKLIRDDLEGQRDTRVLIRNYRKNGEPFDNFLYVFTVLDARGRPLYRIGSQFEVPSANKTTLFENHAAQLRAGVERLNLQVIRLVDMVGPTVKELLQARLTVLRHQI